jgi:hypothetical protein
MTAPDSFGRALDTAPDADACQVARWRAMSPAQKARLVASLSAATIQLAEAGIRARHTGDSPRARFLRLAILRLGRSLAARVYPESEQLAP